MFASRRLAALALACALVSSPAWADPIVLDFNNLSPGDSSATVSTKLTAFIQGIKPGGSVLVSGAKVDRTYDGDRHVTGPVVNGKVQLYSLGTTDNGVGHGGFDNFLANRSDTTTITMVFDFPIYGASFDYQIFPNADVPDGTRSDPSASNWPDFTFKADGKDIFRTLAIIPGDAGTFPNSLLSGPGGIEKAPQFIGQSGFISFAQPVTTLQFVDWPKTIGIDNLTLTTDPPVRPREIPEPGALLLAAAACIGGLALARRRRMTRGDLR